MEQRCLAELHAVTAAGALLHLVCRRTVNFPAAKLTVRFSLLLAAKDPTTVGEPIVGEGAIFLNFLYVHGNCTAVIRFVHESMHGNYPDACKISMHVKSLLQTRIMHGIRLNQGYFIDFRRPPG